MTTSSSTMHETADAANDMIDHGAGELHNFFQDVQDLLVKATPLGDAEATRLREKIEASIDDVKSKAMRGSKRVKDATTAAARSTDSYVRENPWTVAGISALVGIAVGMTLARRS